MASRLHRVSALFMLALGGFVLLAGCIAKADSREDGGNDAAESERVGESEEAVDLGFQIASELHNKCLEILEFSNRNGAPVGMWDCAASPNQRWYWDGRMLRNVMNNKCLEIAGVNPANGAVVTVWDCWGGANQHWYWDGRHLRSELNNKCLEIVNSNPVNRAPVGMWDCWGGAATRWYVR